MIDIIITGECVFVSSLVQVQPPSVSFTVWCLGLSHNTPPRQFPTVTIIVIVTDVILSLLTLYYGIEIVINVVAILRHLSLKLSIAICQTVSNCLITTPLPIAVACFGQPVRNACLTARLADWCLEQHAETQLVSQLSGQPSQATRPQVAQTLPQLNADLLVQFIRNCGAEIP